MKVLFPLAKAGSGSDIFTYNLVRGLQNSSVNSEIQYLPKYSGYVPSIMRKICNPSGYDIIHANLWNGYAFSGLKPVVVVSHSAVRLPDLKNYQKVSQRLFYRYVSRRESSSLKIATVVCCVSKFVSSYLEKMYGFSEGEIIYNGIDTELFSPLKVEDYTFKESTDNKEITLFFAGNRRIMKGYDLLPKIMKELGDGFRLNIAAGLRSEKSSKTQNNIQDLGVISPYEMPALYRSSDIYLFPTRLEGFGLSVAEAMACGKPIVTTDCSSLPELVIDGKGGYLCPMNDVSTFAEAIQHLAEDENLRSRMGKFNRQRVLDHFTIEKMTQEYIRVYRKII